MLSHDWDIYECHDTSRVFYHNPTSGEVSWKPPRGIKSPADNDVKKKVLVRNGDNKEVFTFDRRQSNEEKKENEDENAERTSIVRDSIR